VSGKVAPRGQFGRRTSLGGERGPQSEVLEDALNDARILNQGNDPHRPIEPGAFQRISLIDLALESGGRQGRMTGVVNT